MRTYTVKMDCIISIKMDDGVEPYDFEKIMYKMIKDDLEEREWKVEELNIKGWAELGDKMIRTIDLVLGEKITQLCECCHNWIDQLLLVWDLEEDKLVCISCYWTKSNT